MELDPRHEETAAPAWPDAEAAPGEASPVAEATPGDAPAAPALSAASGTRARRVEYKVVVARLRRLAIAK